MTILFVGEDLIKSRSGVVTVMNQILNDPSLKGDINFKTVYTTSDDYSTPKKLLSWCKAYGKFLRHLPSSKIVHIHHASDFNFWLSAGMVRLANLFGKRSILHNHAADFHEFYDGSSEKAKKKIQKVFSSASGNIVLSKQWLQWYSSIQPKAKWFMLQNTIEVPENIPAKNLEEDKINLIYLARLEQRKGFYDLIEVMPGVIDTFPNVQLYVAGQGDVEAAKALVAQKGIDKNVTILGHINRKQLDELLRLGHILAFPSYNEGLPMALLEAMSYGLVPVTTPVGGIPDVVVSGENGLLVTPGDITALAENLTSLLKDPVRYGMMSVKAYDVINREFNYKNYGAKLKNIYVSVLNDTEVTA